MFPAHPRPFSILVAPLLRVQTSSENRSHYTHAARPDDLIRDLQRYQPHIVHISCHGNTTGEILFLNHKKQAQPISPHALKAVFTALQDNIQLVFLNACYSRRQATAITSVIDCAIGMKTQISDEAATIFAASIYRAIASGRSLQNAFEIGKAALLLEHPTQSTTPTLLHRKGTDPATISFLPSRSPAYGVGPSAEDPHQRGKQALHTKNINTNHGLQAIVQNEIHDGTFTFDFPAHTSTKP